MERRERLHPGWTRDPDYPTFPFPVDSRKGMVVKIVVEDKKIKRVSWQPVMINQKSQPRCLGQSDPAFDEVVNYMKKITRAQKLATEYVTAGDEISMSGTDFAPAGVA